MYHPQSFFYKNERDLSLGHLILVHKFERLKLSDNL